MTEDIQIRTLNRDELAQLEDIAPPEWNTNVGAVFASHYGEPYFHCIGAFAGDRVAGCANGLLNGKAGWLGNIIVRPEWRGRGLGTALTRELMGFFKSQGCTSQLLVATELGEPIYNRLGFTVSSRYVFLRNEQTAHLKAVRGVRPLEAADIPQVLEIDREVTGEERAAFVQKFIASGFVYGPGHKVDGFFLPGLSNGLTLAQTEQAGLALLRFKMARGGPTVVIPEANRAALDLLKRSGYREFARAPRMFFGEEVNWKPGGVFSRGSGYCG